MSVHAAHELITGATTSFFEDFLINSELDYLKIFAHRYSHPPVQRHRGFPKKWSPSPRLTVGGDCAYEAEQNLSSTVSISPQAYQP